MYTKAIICLGYDAGAFGDRWLSASQQAEWISGNARALCIFECASKGISIYLRRLLVYFTGSLLQHHRQNYFCRSKC
jgi:hypothetical protein